MCGEGVIEIVRACLAGRAEIAFAYVHGSALTASAPRDIDIAIVLREDAFATFVRTGGLNLDYAIPLEIELDHALGRKADVHVINRAPLAFRFRVVSQGVAVVDNDPDARAQFEYLSRCEYFDFCPRRREYLAGVTA